MEIGLTDDTFPPRDDVIVTGNHAGDGQERLYIRQLHHPAYGFRHEVPGLRPRFSVYP